MCVDRTSESFCCFPKKVLINWPRDKKLKKHQHAATTAFEECRLSTERFTIKLIKYKPVKIKANCRLLMIGVWCLQLKGSTFNCILFHFFIAHWLRDVWHKRSFAINAVEVLKKTFYGTTHAVEGTAVLCEQEVEVDEL